MNETQPNAAGPQSAGSFDTERASRLRAQAMEVFQGQSRKVIRYMHVWLLICLFFACVTMLMFMTSTDVKSWILYGILFLVMFESTVLIKLWYWVVNSKLAVLRQVKLLRMDLAIQKGSIESLEELATLEPLSQRIGISKWEHQAWRIANTVLAVAMGVIIIMSQGNLRFIASALSVSDLRSTLTLDANGSAMEEVEWEMQNRSLGPLVEFPLSNGGTVSQTTLVPAAESPYSDGLGRKLGLRREPAGLNHRDVIQFVEPVAPFKRFTIRSTAPWRAQATRQGDVWTVRETLGPSSVRIRYAQTITLPPGAEVVTVDPPPKAERSQQGRLVLHLESQPRAGQTWTWTVQYRLSR